MPLPGPRLRLALFAVVVVGLYLAFVVTDVVRPAEVRAWVAPYGAVAPFVFVVVSAGLGLCLVPGPVLAGASGLLFGAVVGTPVTLAASILSAVLALLIGRRIGREGVEQMSGRRITALTRWLEEHGFEAVVVARLAPILPDSWASYAAGVGGIRVWQMAAGTAVGAAPRAFAYTALGGSLDDLTSPLALVAISVLVVVGVVGAEAVRRQARRSRSARAALAEGERG